MGMPGKRVGDPGIEWQMQELGGRYWGRVGDAGVGSGRRRGDCRSKTRGCQAKTWEML